MLTGTIIFDIGSTKDPYHRIKSGFNVVAFAKYIESSTSDAHDMVMKIDLPLAFFA